MEKRSKVILHMMISLDGKATGSFWGKKSVQTGMIEYFRIHKEKLNAQAMAFGRKTLESFSVSNIDYSKFKGKKISRDDYIVEKNKDCKYYYIAYDTNGKLNLENSIIDAYTWIGNPNNEKCLCQVILVLSENVEDYYLNYLKSIGISYIFAGKKKIDIELSLNKLKNKFGIETILLEGGPIISQSFLMENLIDEISLIICPLVGGKGETLFLDGKIVEYNLEETEKIKDGNIWVYYKKK